MNIARRFSAYIIDWYLSTMLCMLPTVIFQSIQAKDLILENRIDNLPLNTGFLSTILSIALFMIYYCVIPLYNEHNQTPGRRFMNLGILKKGNLKVDFTSLFIREVIGVLLLQGVLTTVSIYFMSLTQQILHTDVVPYFHGFYYLMILISLISYFFTKTHTTIHDRISGTFIIKLTTNE